MSASLRLIFIAFFGIWVGLNIMLTRSLHAQELEGLEAAQNNQPAPTNLSPEESRNHFLNCPGGPSTQFRMGGRVKNPNLHSRYASGVTHSNDSVGILSLRVQSDRIRNRSMDRRTAL